YELDKAYLDLPTIGNVSVYDASVGGNELIRIAAKRYQVDYLTNVLWPAPSAVWTFYVDYTRDMLNLMQPTDRPLLPEDFHDLVLMGARYSDYEFKKDLASMKVTREEMLSRASALFNWVNNNPDQILVPGQQPRGTRFSNLGSWFPSGTW